MTALRELVDVPVETADERFTTALAQRFGGSAPEDAVAAAHLLQSWLDRGARGVSRTAAARCRRQPLLLVAGCGSDDDAARRRRRSAAGRQAAAHHLPGRAQRPRDGRPRRRRAQDRDREAGRDPEADARPATSPPSRGRGRRRPSCATGSAARWRASSSRRSTSSHSSRTANELVADSADGVPEGVRARQPLVRALEEPDAVRRAQDRVDDREGDGGAGRAEARRRRDLQPPPPEDAARDRCHDPLRAEHPRHRVADEGGDRERQPVQQPTLPRSAADPDREPRPRLDQGGRSSGRASTTSTTSAFPERGGTSSRRARASSCARCASSATPATSTGVPRGEMLTGHAELPSAEAVPVGDLTCPR